MTATSPATHRARPRRRRAATRLLGGAAAAIVTACSAIEPAAPPTTPAVTAAPTGSTPTGSTPTSSTPTGSASTGSALTGPVDTRGVLRPTGETTTVATGLAAPWSLVFVGSTALVSERDSGRILELAADGTPREVGVVAGVTHGGEGGLLGLAARDGAVWVYSTGERANRVQRYELVGAPGSYRLGGATTVLDGIPANSTHNGGRIAFGPDGMLYIGTGDAQNRGAAQDPASLSGKILRIRPDGRVPDDNPVAGSPVWSLGHRNVQGLAWTADGRMWASEFGQNTWDELNLVERGANHGWPEVEGRDGSGDGFVPPLLQWATDEASPSGIAAVGGTVFVANLRGAVLRSVPVTDPAAQQEHLAGLGRIRDVVAAPDGRLWVVTNNTDGRGDPRDGDDRIVAVTLG